MGWQMSRCNVGRDVSPYNFQLLGDVGFYNFQHWMTWARITLNSMDFVSSILVGRSSCKFISSYFLQTNIIWCSCFLVVFWLISHAKPTWLLDYWGWSCTVSKLWLTWIGQTKQFDAENLGLEVLLAQLVPPFLLFCLQPNAKPNCA